MKNWIQKIKQSEILQNRKFLLGILMLVLGGSLSWNPGYMTMARNEYVMQETYSMASTLKTGSNLSIPWAEIDTNKVAKSAIPVTYLVSDQNEIGYTVFYVASFSNPETNKIDRVEGRFEFKKEDPTTDEAIRARVQAEVKLKFQNAIGNSVPDANKGSTSKEKFGKFETTCSNNEDGDLAALLNCRLEDYEAYAEDCKTFAIDQADVLQAEEDRRVAKAERESYSASQKDKKRHRTIRAKTFNPNYQECRKNLNDFYRKYLAKDIRQNCASGYGTTGYQACRDGVGRLFGADLKPDVTIQEQILGNVFNSVVQQAYDVCGLKMTGFAEGFSGHFMSGMTNMNPFACMQSFVFQNSQIVGPDIFRSAWNGLGGSNSYYNSSLRQSYSRSFENPSFQFGTLMDNLVRGNSQATRANFQTTLAPYSVNIDGLMSSIDANRALVNPVVVAPGALGQIPQPTRGIR